MCSVGVDLDLIPYVADVQATTDLPVLAVLPARDLVAITRDMAALLDRPIEFATVD